MVEELIPATSFPSSIQTKSNLKPLRPVSELSRLLFRSTHSSLQTVLLFYSADSSDDSYSNTTFRNLCCLLKTASVIHSHMLSCFSLTGKHFQTTLPHTTLCVCGCVRERERDRQRHRER